jgi:hypothetical protein
VAVFAVVLLDGTEDREERRLRGFAPVVTLESNEKPEFSSRRAATTGSFRADLTTHT